MSDQRHPYAGHPATPVLDAHGYTGWSVTAPVWCDCRKWRGPARDYPAHLAEVLDQAGLLADGPPPVTLTARVLAERADRRTM